MEEYENALEGQQKRVAAYAQRLLYGSILSERTISTSLWTGSHRTMGTLCAKRRVLTASLQWTGSCCSSF